MALPDLRTHTDAVIAVLEAAGLAVGDGVAPNPAPEKFAVVYGPWGTSDGDLDGLDEDLRGVWQVTSVGRTREQCDWVRTKVAEALLRDELVIADRAVHKVQAEYHQPERDATAHLVVDGKTVRPLWTAPDRFHIWTTPS